MLAFLGGTGPEGKGLALRLAMAGEAVVIGSRDAGRAQERRTSCWLWRQARPSPAR